MRTGLHLLMLGIRQRNGSARESRTGPRRHRGWLTLGLVLALQVIPTAVAGQKESAGEYELKAAMLYNLTNFVDWPVTVSPGARKVIFLCVIGRDPFGDSLTSTDVNGPGSVRFVSIRHIQSDKEFAGCHVLYIGSSERKAALQIFSSVKSSSVLTVGEMTQFAERGGMVQFSLEEQRIRFDINLDAVSRSRLKMSSKLLALAHIVTN
jgi:hypothetical protein